MPRTAGSSLRIACSIVLGVVLLAACGSDDGVSGDGATSTAVADSGPAPSADCVDVHAGHSAMMWNPTMADEMLAAGCGWPYEPFLVDLDGGEDDPELDAPFEPVRYSDLWSAITASDVGVCSVGTIRDGDEVGRAFGFSYSVGPPGCPGAASSGALLVSEFGTEAQRDAAARDAATSGTTTYVLGRWVLELEGDTAEIDGALDAMGAQAVS